MRKRRFKMPHGDAFYHCMSRTVNGEGLNTRVRFKEVDKEVFRRMIWKVAEFSGVDILSYCIMNNHFHVFIRVPCTAREVSDAELVRRYKILYPKPTNFQTMAPHVLEAILAAGGAQADLVRRGLLKRMGDVSEYMKTLKQRFSVYFNRTHQRTGTLWAERFKSVLVEPEYHALLAVSAYVDLNAVRAGLVSDPKDYRFCSYAEAISGSKVARKGVALTLAGYITRHQKDHMAHYRMALFGVGAHKNRESSAFISREKAIRVLEKERGKLPLATLLRCRARYFTDGLVLGSAAYIHSLFGDTLKKPPCELPIELDGDCKGLAVAKGFRGPIVS